MATKDWKKFKGIKQPRWELQKPNYDQICVSRIKERYEVGTVFKGHLKWFKTKSQALRFAKSYMRKH